MHCRKSLLFDNTDIWTKKESNKDFDVTISSFEGRSLCLYWSFYFIYIKYQIWEKPYGICRETADLITFTEEILNGKIYYLCS